MYDCAIVGTGAAGVSAALTLKSLGVNFIWFGKKSLSAKIEGAEKIKNYPGLCCVSGKQLLKAFLNQIKSENIEITEKTVNGIYDLDGRYSLACGEDFYEAKTVILAVGVEAIKPILGEEELLGKGVSYCATCDGFLYRGKDIAVVCSSAEHEKEAEFLATVAKKVYFFPIYKGAEFSGENVETVAGMPREIVGGDRVEGVKVNDKIIKVDGVFMLKNSVAPSVLLAGLKSAEGHVIVDRLCRTNKSGVFAAGDCTGRPYQYAKATGEGNVAAHSVFDYLSNERRQNGRQSAASIRL